MGLEEPDLDLEELLNNNDDEEDNGRDISDMSRKEACLEVLKTGQINLGENRALIKCPCSKSEWIGDDTVEFVCALSMRPDPENGEQKPVCSGPIKGLKTWGSGKQEWKGGSGVRSNCPYDPARFRREG